MPKKLTRGEKKLLLQFENVIQTDQFAKMVLLARSRSGIPPFGFTPTTDDRKHLWQEDYVPEVFSKKSRDEKINFLTVIKTNINPIIDLLSVDNLYFRILVKNYICFNKFFHKDARHEYTAWGEENLCYLVDEQILFSESITNKADSSMNREYIENVERKLKKYPLAIWIHPDASIRDIKDFIEKNSFKILGHLNYHTVGNSPTVKNSKTKTNSKITKRNQFIFKHKSLPRKEIAKLLRENGYDPLDVGTIGKIISLQKKKRE